MPTGSVTTYHESGGAISSDVKADRVSAKVGVAEIGDANKIYVINNPNMAKDIFGQGELVDSIKQYFEEFNEDIGQKPVPLLCIRPENDTAGSIEVPVAGAENTGLAALPTTSGTPTGSRTIVIKFTKEGASETAEYRRSLDGGESFEAAVVTPASGSAISLAVGVSATFTDNATTPADTFKVGDVFTFVINGPTASNLSKLTAIEKLKQEYRMNWLHLLGGVDRAFAVSVNSILTEMEVDHNLPTFAILEVRQKAISESVADYYQYIQDEFDPFLSDRVSIVTSEGKYIAGGVENAGGYEIVKSGSLGVWRNAATMLTAKLACGASNVSAGFVRDMKSLTFSEIRYWQEGYQDYMDVMHDMKLTVLKQYNDYDGVFIARDRIKSANDSDFADIPERRRADKMHRIVYKTSLPYLNADSESNSGSSGIDYLNADVSAEVSKQMPKQGEAEISKFKLIFDPEKNFSQTKILQVKLIMYIKGRMKAIEWTTSFAKA